MRRTQILLDARQHATLRSWAVREGTSVSALIRRLVDAALSQHRIESGRAWLDGISGIATQGSMEESEQDRLLYEEEDEATSS